LKTFFKDDYIRNKIQHNCDWLDYENLLLMIMYSTTFGPCCSQSKFVKKIISSINNKLSKKYHDFIEEIYFKYDQSKVKCHNENSKIGKGGIECNNDYDDMIKEGECARSFRDENNRIIHEEGSFYHEDAEGFSFHEEFELVEGVDEDFDFSDNVSEQITEELKGAYRIVEKYEKQGVNQGPVYGELSLGSFKKIVKYLKLKCHMDERSRFIDIGSGLGKPNFHIAMDSKIALSIGVECEKPRYQLAMKILQQMKKFIHPHRTGFLNMNIADATTFVSM
jgi:hypothetical protein